jgi:hypothetical protein
MARERGRGLEVTGVNLKSSTVNAVVNPRNTRAFCFDFAGSHRHDLAYAAVVLEWAANSRLPTRGKQLGLALRARVSPRQGRRWGR